jgi:hypothetical protein
VPWEEDVTFNSAESGQVGAGVTAHDTKCA